MCPLVVRRHERVLFWIGTNKNELKLLNNSQGMLNKGEGQHDGRVCINASERIQIYVAKTKALVNPFFPSLFFSRSRLLPLESAAHPNL